MDSWDNDGEVMDSWDKDDGYTRSSFDILVEAGLSEDAAWDAIDLVYKRIVELEEDGMRGELEEMNIAKAIDIFGERGATAAMHLWNAGCLV